MKWFPDGLDMSTSLPSLPMTAAVLFSIASVFGKIDLMTFAAIMPAFMAVISCLVLYFVGKDMGGRAVGLFAALFLALAPSFLQRSSLGFFDTEIPGVLGLVLFIFLFLRSMDGSRSLKASLFYAVGAGLSLAYFIAGWGAAYYVIALAVPLRLRLGSPKTVQPKNAHQLQHNLWHCTHDWNQGSLSGPGLPDFRCSASSCCSVPRPNSSRTSTKQHINKKQNDHGNRCISRYSRRLCCSVGNWFTWRPCR